MKTSKSTLQQIANGNTSLTGQAVEVARTILTDGLYSQFSRYAFYYGYDSDELGDIQDLLLDFSCFGGEVRMKVSTDIHPFGTWQVFGMKPSITLERLMSEISNMPYAVSQKLENSVFTIKGIKGKFSYISTYFHYCFAEGRISEQQLLEMCRVA